MNLFILTQLKYETLKKKDRNKFYSYYINQYTEAAETSSPVQRARKFSAETKIKTRLQLTLNDT